MEFDFSKLCGRIVEKFGTRSAFCKAIGMPEPTLSNKLNNKTQFSPDDMYTMCLPEFLDIPGPEMWLYFFTPKVR